MPKKALVVLLTVLWVIVSGLDALEDIDLPNAFEIQNAVDLPVSGEQTGRLVNNIIELAEHSRTRQLPLLSPVTAKASVYTFKACLTNFRLHKLHHVFLI